jgi:hypothetical protein
MILRGRPRVRPHPSLGTALAVHILEDRRLLSGLAGGLAPRRSLPGGHAEVVLVTAHEALRQESGTYLKATYTHGTSAESNGSGVPIRPSLVERRAAGDVNRGTETASGVLNEPRDRGIARDLSDPAAIPKELPGTLRLEPRSSDVLSPQLAPAGGSSDHLGNALSSALDHTSVPEELIAGHGERRGLEGFHSAADLGISVTPARALHAVLVRGASRSDDRPSEPLRLDLEVGSGSDSAPAPRSSGLLTDFLPFDRSSLAEAIDRFLVQFEDIRAELSEWPSPSGVLSAAAAIASVTLASEAARRSRLRGDRRTSTGEDGHDEFARLPGFPDAWTLGRI